MNKSARNRGDTYFRSGNIREVLIFANFTRRTNSLILDSFENYYYNSAIEELEPDCTEVELTSTFRVIILQTAKMELSQ